MKILDEQEQLTEDTAESVTDAPDISVFLPVFNEEPNLLPLHAKLDEALKTLGRSAEIVYVDDGSTDGSLKILREIAATRSARARRCAAAKLRSNSGDGRRYRRRERESSDSDGRRSAKRSGGHRASAGKTRRGLRRRFRLAQKSERQDGHAQDTFDDRESFDLVDWRRAAARLRLFVEGLPARVVAGRSLYGEMHRFIPIYAAWAGARVTEIPVEHHARTMGKSKYGLSRTLKVVFDLMTIKFMASYQTKPIYVFGSFGMLAFAISLLSGLYAVFLKIFHKADFVQTPLPILCIVMFAVGVQFLLMGLLAEMLVRTYHESQAKAIYAVRERLGFQETSE